MANINESKKYHFIYKTTNLLSGEYYVGMHSTSNLKDGYLGSGTRLRRSIRKYGESNFKLEILEFFSTREELVKREKELVNEDLIKDSNCLNLKPGGSGGFSKEWAHRGMLLANVKRKQLLEEDPKFKEKFSMAVKAGLKAARRSGRKIGFQDTGQRCNWKGRKHNLETIERMKLAAKSRGKGQKNSQFGTMWITDGNSNKKLSKTNAVPEGWRTGRIIKKTTKSDLTVL